MKKVISKMTILLTVVLIANSNPDKIKAENAKQDNAVIVRKIIEGFIKEVNTVEKKFTIESVELIRTTDTIYYNENLNITSNQLKAMEGKLVQVTAEKTAKKESDYIATEIFQVSEVENYERIRGYIKEVNITERMFIIDIPLYSETIPYTIYYNEDLNITSTQLKAMEGELAEVLFVMHIDENGGEAPYTAITIIQVGGGIVGIL